MYLYHFGLNELPFTLTPNTHYYYGLPTHRQALDVLNVALQTGEGFIKVIGEVGTGKTLVCRKLLNELPEEFVSAYIPNPYLSPNELRKAVAAELSIDIDADADPQTFTQKIQEQLISINQARQSVVLIIDEAQALPVESIEALRLFTNLETESRKLMHVVLFAQPELDDKLNLPELRQLKQRISFSYYLEHMDKHQLTSYVQHRISVAGYRGEAAFNKACCNLLYKASRGTPRIVNVLCHKALMLAYGEGVQSVTAKHVKLAIADTESTYKSGNRGLLVAAAVASLALTTIAVISLQGPEQLIDTVLGLLHTLGTGALS